MMRSTFTFSLLLALSACGRTGSQQPHDPLPDEPSDTGGAPNVEPTDDGAGGAVVEPMTGCEHPHPGAAPLSILGNEELRLTLQQLLGTAERAERLPPEDTFGVVVSTLYIEVLHDIAHTAAQGVIADAKRLADVVDCDPATGEEACQTHFIEHFLRKAFRRPATAEDRAEMAQVFQRGQELGGNFESGVRAVIEVTLQSPEFLYLVELGTGPAHDGVVSLTPFETASRLSYFMTGGPPDEELLEAAANDRLQQGSGLEEQLGRLLGSAANREHVVSFYQRLYGLYNDGSAELPLSADLLQLAQEESRRFIEDATFVTGTFRALLTEPTTWVNEPLARFYGYPDVTGDAFRQVQVDPGKRGGLFTQQTFLDATSHGRRTNPIARGFFVLNRLLCTGMPTPPVLDPITPPPAVDFPTARERFTAATSGATCAGCHSMLNPVGFAFEHYDSVGLYRDEENGQPIDSSGTLSLPNIHVSFQNAPELLAHIANSEQGQACFVSHWLDHAFRRKVDQAEDTCVHDELNQSFIESGGNVVQLMLALAKSDQFKYRLNSELAP